jgi:hypothetical protein
MSLAGSLWQDRVGSSQMVGFDRDGALIRTTDRSAQGRYASQFERASLVLFLAIVKCEDEVGIALPAQNAM